MRVADHGLHGPGASAVVVSEHLETPLYAARPSVAAAQQRLLYLPPLSPPLLTSSFD